MGVEGGIVATHLHLAVQFVGSGLGENLDAAVAKAVVFGRKRILVDANLANGGFRRKLTAGKSIDVDLPAVRTGCRTGESRQFVLQLIGIVGKGVEILTLDDDGAGIGVGGGADGGVLRLDFDLLLLDLNLECGVDAFHLAGGNRDAGNAISRETLRRDPNAVGSRSEATDGVGSTCVRSSLAGHFAFAVEHDDGSAGNDGARRIGNLTVDAAGVLRGRRNLRARSSGRSRRLGQRCRRRNRQQDSCKQDNRQRGYARNARRVPRTLPAIQNSEFHSSPVQL